PSFHKMQQYVSLRALGIATLLTVTPVDLPIGLNKIAGAPAVFAETSDPRTLKKMERTVKRAERKLTSVERDITRMESDASRIRSSQLERTEEKITDIAESLNEVDAGFEGLSDLLVSLATFTSRLKELQSAYGDDTGSEASGGQANDMSVSDQRRLQSQISRVKKNIANAEKALERYLTEPALTSARLQGVAQDRITAAKDKLSDLTALSPEAASHLEPELTDIVRRFDVRAAEDVTYAENKDVAARKLEDMKASGAFEARLVEIKLIQEQATQFEYLDWNSYIFLDDSNASLLSGAANSWPDITIAFDEYMRDNADIMALGGALPTLSLVLQKKLPSATENLAKLSHSLLPLYEAKAHDIVMFAKEIADEGNFRLFDLRVPDRKSVVTELKWLESWLAFYIALPKATPQTEAALRSNLADTIAEIDRIKEAGRGKIIAQNSLDADVYSGADRDEIIRLVEAGWRTVHGDAPIRDIRIPSGQWTRTTGERWDKVDRMFVRVDFSTIDAFVVEEPKDGVVTYWRVEMQKRHLEDNALISNPASRNRHAPKPDQQMLAENL
ncbi:MAG: hypothetical protein ABJZ69_00515, partial [Hyphomicrobiales bacterium]